jgi:hypothetical protein
MSADRDAALVAGLEQRLADSIAGSGVAATTQPAPFGRVAATSFDQPPNPATTDHHHLERGYWLHDVDRNAELVLAAYRDHWRAVGFQVRDETATRRLVTARDAAGYVLMVEQNRRGDLILSAGSPTVDAA